MQKSNFSILAYSILFFSSCQPDLTCADFNIGTFHLSSDDFSEKITIIRSANAQIEYIGGIENGDPKKLNLKWLDECTYHLMYDESYMALGESEKWSNDNNGVVVSKVEIRGRCMSYVAKMITPEGKEIIRTGEMCKE